MASDPPMISRMIARGFRAIPTNLVSGAWGRFTRTQASRQLIGPFSKVFGVNLEESERPADEYPTLNAFFTRRLKPGSRPIDPHPRALVSPVDGQLSESGRCDGDRLLQVKGIHYDLFGLLQDADQSRHFENGTYLTLYLSPRDYHRFHAPLDMHIDALGYLPGNLYPVNPPSVHTVPGLYTRNERVVIYADSPAGQMALVAVGAHCVGSISLTFHDLVTNRPGRRATRLNFKEKKNVNQGDELGAFEMGSTVILLFARDRIRLELPNRGDQVRLGRRLGTVVDRKKEMPA